MTDIQLPPLPWGDDLTAWLEGRNDAEVEEQIQAYARAAIEAEKLHTDKLLLASVPGRWKSCASSVGSVQSYIAELEAAIEAHEARRVPDGWQLVPIEPTLEMVGAWKTVEQQAATEVLYRTMLASAPPAPQASKKPLFGELIAQHEGLAEELKTIDAEVDRQHRQASVTAPVREPLSDKQREAVVAAANATLEHGAPMSWEHALIDAVEAAHKIGGKQ